MTSLQDKEKPTIRVVAALIQNTNGQLLITQRNSDAFLPLKWEFPGGKVEAGESDQEALARELLEELGVLAVVGEEFMGLVHEYDRFNVDFHVYRCSLSDYEVQKIGVNDYRWVSISQLDSFDFPPADQPTVSKLLG